MPCNKNTSACRVRSKGDPLPLCCKNHLKEILFNLDDLLTLNNIPYWIDYGTLLGAVRENDILPHDEDGDIGILRQDVDKLLSLSFDLLKRNLFVCSYGFPDAIRVEYGKLNTRHIDIFFWEFNIVSTKYIWEGDDKIKKKLCLTRRSYQFCDKLKGRDIPVEDIFPLSTIQLGGKTYPCPHDPENFARFRYGTDWNVPKVM